MMTGDQTEHYNDCFSVEDFELFLKKKKVPESLKIKIKLSFIKCLHFKKAKDSSKVNTELKKDTCLQTKNKVEMDPEQKA